MTVRSGWLLNRDSSGGGQTREDTRLVPVGTYFPTAELTTRGGMVPGGNPFVLTSAGTMACTIGVGRAIITGTTAQGAYPVAVTTAETLTFADGDATYPRKDSVMLAVYDTLYDTSGLTLAKLEIVQGTPAATPVAPTATGTREKLYEITVPAGASTGNGGINWTTGVTDKRRTTVPLGGINAGGWSSSYSGSYAGQYRDNGGTLERWDGTAWQTYLPPLTTSSSGASAGTGFTLVSFSGRKRGGCMSVVLTVSRTSTNVTPDDSVGNMGDITLGTLPSSWRPVAQEYGSAGDGFANGELTVDTTGVVTLRSWSSGASLVTGRNIRSKAVFVV